MCQYHTMILMHCKNDNYCFSNKSYIELSYFSIVQCANELKTNDIKFNCVERYCTMTLVGGNPCKMSLYR